MRHQQVGPMPFRSRMTRQEATELVDAAVDRLVAEQPELLDLDVSERALSHHLAIYLAEFLPAGLQVDVEYNRHGACPKRLNLPPREASDRELPATTVFPDIVIHRRGSDDSNLVVLELKKPQGSLEYDRRKLRAFRRELGYAHAAHVVLGRDSQGCLVRDLIWVDV